jgi:hypothetical protein
MCRTNPSVLSYLYNLLFILNSGEADMLSGPVSKSTPWTLSRPERSGCGNGLPNPVTGAHGLAVMASSFNRADVGSCESGDRPHRG